MSVGYDILIIGSGPAGVSAAFPLVAAGLRVLMLDAATGEATNIAHPDGGYLEVRRQQPRQDWFYDMQALGRTLRRTPKLNIPAFRDTANDSGDIATTGFTLIRSLAAGGLSGAWGAGVSVFDDEDMREWPLRYADLKTSYDAVISRIGVSGMQSASSQPAMALDGNHRYLYDAFNRKKPAGITLWPSHNAVLTQDRGDRKSCNRSGFCLWGCSRQSVWNAQMDIALLERHANFSYRPGYLVQKLQKLDEGWRCAVIRRLSGESSVVDAPKVVLAAGTVASSQIALASLAAEDRVTLPLRSNPCAAFMLWLPARSRAEYENAYGMAQLSFKVSSIPIHGNLFSASFIPFLEYLAASGLSYRYGAQLLSLLAPSMVIANCFLDGSYSSHRMEYRAGAALHIHGGYRDPLHDAVSVLKKELVQGFRQMGALLVPGSFRLGDAGSDIHYACSLPMQASPGRWQTHPDGRLAGQEGLYIADGAVLPGLPHKPLTLTIMANADRIGRLLAASVKASVV